MPSFKRRRAINVDFGYIDSLKQVSERHFRGKKSATAVASMIFEGKYRTLYCVKIKGKSRGISMTEAIWLSIRCRSEIIRKPISTTTQLILEGTEPHLTPREISFGEKRAREREERRAAGDPEEASGPPPKVPLEPSEKPPEPAAAPGPLAEPPIAEQEEPGDIGIECVGMSISEPVAEEVPEQVEKEANPPPDVDTTIEAISIDAMEQIHEAEAEAAARAERNMKLSKGYPANPEECDGRGEKRAIPGLDYYSGVFSI